MQTQHFWRTPPAPSCPRSDSGYFPPPPFSSICSMQPVDQLSHRPVRLDPFHGLVRILSLSPLESIEDSLCPIPNAVNPRA